MPQLIRPMDRIAARRCSAPAHPRHRCSSRATSARMLAKHRHAPVPRAPRLIRGSKHTHDIRHGKYQHRLARTARPADAIPPPPDGVCVRRIASPAGVVGRSIFTRASSAPANRNLSVRNLSIRIRRRIRRRRIRRRRIRRRRRLQVISVATPTAAVSVRRSG